MSLLKTIIKDMYIDPDLLELMGEEQKQILFRKIREEQIRRWNIKDKELGKGPPKKNTPRKVNFLHGSDDKPWVWVMGEHKEDILYDELVGRRELKKLKEEDLAEIMEAEKLAKKGIMSIINSERKVESGICEVDGLGATDSQGGFIRTESQADVVKGAKQDAPTSLSSRKLKRRRSILGETPEERQKFEQETVAEVLGTLRRSKSVAKKRAEEMAKKLEDNWRESQKKADVYDRSRKRSFRSAREKTVKSPNIHEKILEDLPMELEKMSLKKPARPAPAPPGPRSKKLLKMSSFVEIDSTPRSADHVVAWFKEVEAPKGVGKETDGSISIWFHGKIGRESANRVLEKQPIGSFLIRLSAKLWGYTVSVKSLEGSRHFLLDASSGHYSFLGPKQRTFKTLIAMLEYYKTNPITWEGQEILLLPVAMDDERDVYGGLFSGDSEEEEENSAGSVL